MFTTIRRLPASVVLIAASSLASAQTPTVPAPQEIKTRADAKGKAVLSGIRAVFEPATARRGQTVTWKLSMEVVPGWHTYPTEKTAPGNTSLNVIPAPDKEHPLPPDVIFVGELEEPPKPITFQEQLAYEGTATWKHALVVSPKASPGPKLVEIPVKLQVCNDQTCLPQKLLTVAAPLTISSDEPQEVDAPHRNEVELAFGSRNPLPFSNGAKPENPPTVPATSDGAKQASQALDSPENLKASLDRVQAQLVHSSSNPGGTSSGHADDLLGFILLGAGWGAISLITPCVFPMIPITVSFFLKQSEKEGHRPVFMAVVYAATIVVVLTTAAVALLTFFRALSVHPWTNVALGGLFIFFALSLFGMYDIELPSGLTRFTSQREGKGGVVGTIFMALTFTIVSFACVAPFLGGFGGTAASANHGLGKKLLGGLAFSATFASPFFLLALFPTFLKKLPRSGSWLNRVKVVMGFLELAAAFAFFRTAEVRFVHPSGFFAYDFVLCVYVAIGVLCGLYLLNVYRLPHDSPEEHVGVLQMLFGFFFLTLSLNLAPALFSDAKGRRHQPGGTFFAWVDAILLPESVSPEAVGNLELAIEEARPRNELVFVDFTGVTCKNCKYNEANVFTKPRFQEIFRKYKVVQLYTDLVPNSIYPVGIRDRQTAQTRQKAAEVNLDFQRKIFDTEELPLYVVLKPLPNGKTVVLGSQGGKINDEESFARFLSGHSEG